MVNSIAYLKSIYKENDYTVPRIHVTNLTHSLNKDAAGFAGVVAIVGAFPNNDHDIQAFSSYDSMLRYYGVEEGTAVEKAFNGLLAAKQILRTRGHSEEDGASAVLIANITEYTDTALTTINTYDSTHKDAPLMDDKGKIYRELTSFEGLNVALDTAYDKVITKERLVQALNKLYTENFDFIFTADDFTATKTTVSNVTVQTGEGDDEEGDEPTTSTTSTSTTEKVITPLEVAVEIQKFLQDEFRLQRPAQYIAPLITQPRANAGNTATVNVDESINEEDIKAMYALFKDDVFSCGGFYTQRIFIDYAQEPLSLIETAAYITGYIAATRIEQPLTYQTIPGITGVYDELSVGKNDTGYLLANMGFPVIVCKLRNSIAQTAQYCVLNSQLPSGYDLAQIRAVSYLIKQYDLQQFLGLPNDEATRAQIGAELSMVNKRVMQDVAIIDEITTSNPIVPERNGKACPREVYIELNVVVHGVIIVIQLGVNMEEYSGQARVEEEIY